MPLARAIRDRDRLGMRRFVEGILDVASSCHRHAGRRLPHRLRADAKVTVRGVAGISRLQRQTQNLGLVSTRHSSDPLLNRCSLAPTLTELSARPLRAISCLSRIEIL